MMKKTIAALTALLLCGSLLQTVPASAEYRRASVHDPSVVKLQEGGYYIIGSHLGAARSGDLMNWTPAANSDRGSTNTTFFRNIYTDLAIPEKWSNTTAGYNLAGNMWAPDIIWNPDMGKYCMYLSVNGQVWNSSVVLCTADQIDGPYTYQGTIVYSGFTNGSVNNVNDTDVPRVLGRNPDIGRYLSNGSWNASYGTNAIDPAVFYDEGGNLWMVYGSWFGGIYMLELDEKTGLRDYNVKYETVPNVSDAYMGKKAAGGNFVSGEGPYIEYMKAPGAEKGYYYLFVSYGFFNSNGGYNMRIFRSERPDGPYLDQNGNSAIYPRGGDNIRGNIGERLMSNYQWSCNDRPFKAQGHNSALMDDDGRLYVIYHTKFDDPYGFHEVRVHQLIMNEDGWFSAAPYEFSGESLSEKGHALAAVAGDYELIVHTLDQKFENEKSADVERPRSITLREDGSISGDMQGTWTMQNGTPYMSITAGGTVYKGAFLVQADESAAQTVRMTFTATGNNTCIWGSKKSAYDAAADTVELLNDKSALVYAPDTAQGFGASLRIGDTDLFSGIPCTLTNQNSNLLLSTQEDASAPGTNAMQWAKHQTPAQEWRIVACEDGYCRILSMADEGKCLAVAENSAENGQNVELQTWTGADNQRWKLIKQEQYYGIVSKCSADKAGLDVFDFSRDNGGNINQWEFWGGNCQLWKITPVCPAVPDGAYTLTDVHSGERTPVTMTRQADGNYTIDNGTNALSNVTLRANRDGSYALNEISYVIEPQGAAPQKVIGDVDADGTFGLRDIIMMQKYLLNAGTLTDPEAGDLHEDGMIDVFDLALLKRLLIASS
ncbi:MAG: family 43 glycosylhydrolase [Oscillospiraceae bacterium]|nr:family 43 glycosylhydrolase [Oscillospiraceae bacterium]